MSSVTKMEGRELGFDQVLRERSEASETGQLQESGRDQAHAQLGIGLLAALCETARNQGDDLYSTDDNRLLKGFEYKASYLDQGSPSRASRSLTRFRAPRVLLSEKDGVPQALLRARRSRGSARFLWRLGWRSKHAGRYGREHGGARRSVGQRGLAGCGRRSGRGGGRRHRSRRE
jgi:hypothetical protein